MLPVATPPLRGERTARAASFRLALTAAALLFVAWIAAGSVSAQEKGDAPAVPGPYVDVFRGDDVVFQVRRDRIKKADDGSWRVWMRWLWAMPKRWKSDEETATVILAFVDCEGRRVRELAVMHKNRAAEIYDVEERGPDQEWTAWDPRTRAGEAMNRLCEFIPVMVEMKESESRKP